MNSEYKLYGSVEGSDYQNFLHETWQRIPDWVKIWRDNN